MTSNKNDYLKYLSKLNINQLRVEACSVVNYLDNLIGVYNDLIYTVENDFIVEIQRLVNFNYKDNIKDIIYKKLKQLEFFLDIEVSNLFGKKTYRCETNLADYLEMNYIDLLEDIMFNYSLIFEINEHQCPIPGTENDGRFKVLNYSWYDALNFLSSKLLERIKVYYNELNNIENAEIYAFVKRVTKEIIELVEEYGDHYIDQSRCYKDLLDDENYEILTKYNCYNQIIKTLKSNLLKNFDFTDFKNFFKKSKIIKIIYEEKEIILSPVKPNKFLILGYADYTINQIENNITYYKEQCINNNCEYLFGKSNQLLIIYLS
jgi:hypothetical protein